MPDTELPHCAHSSSEPGSSVFDRCDTVGRPHEQVVFCHDPESGLRAIIALWSTALGPGLGGTRFFPYPSEGEALADVLALSRAMAYKAAISGLDLGGGKAVIIGDPATDKSEPLLRAYGRFVQSLAGRYWTACDVGTYVADMDVIARECRYVTGRSPENGGAGDSSVLTALGVHEAMLAAAEHRWGTPSLDGRRVAVEGVGKVGHHLVGHLLADGAAVVACDVSSAALDRLRGAYPGVEVVEPDVLPTLPVDVYSPCALGGAITPATLASLQAEVVCGAANNQLAGPEMDQALFDAGVLYAPDYLVNAGGLIQVADERHGYSEPRARRRATGIHATTAQVLAEAARTGRPTGATADAVAERRMAQVGRLRAIHLPH